MEKRQPPVIDMSPDGEFRTVGFRLPLPTKIFLIALAVSVVAGIVASAALVIYLSLLLIPVVLAVAAAGYVSMRLQAWRAGKQRGIVRF
jgi:hypothetical protein